MVVTADDVKFALRVIATVADMEVARERLSHLGTALALVGAMATVHEYNCNLLEAMGFVGADFSRQGTS
jgi:hypothetical protein